MENAMATITVEIDDQLLEKVKHIALEKRISVEAVVDEKLKEFVSACQRKKAALEGLENFYRKCEAKVGQVTWRREELHDR
jgi:predicted transcriptional regulator